MLGMDGSLTFSILVSELKVKYELILVLWWIASSGVILDKKKIVCQICLPVIA